jgi:hypothetical protein
MRILRRAREELGTVRGAAVVEAGQLREVDARLATRFSTAAPQALERIADRRR